MTAPLLFLLVTGAMCSSCVDAFAQNGQNRRSATADSTVLTLEVLQHDPVLNHIVALHLNEARLDDVFKALTDQRNLKLTVTSDLAPRRITARCKYAPIASIMIALSRVMGVSWRRSGDGYNLFQTTEQMRAEARKKRESEAREQRFVEAQGNILRAQVQSALSQKGMDRDVFADFLAGCDHDTINRGIASALEDEPILSAVDQSHFHNHFLSARPFSTLDSGQQATVRQIARGGGYSHLDAGSSVGLIAAAGGFRLGIVEPDGRDVWVAPQHSIGQVNTVSQNAREDDFDSKVVEQLRSDRLIVFGALSNTLRRKTPKINKGLDRSRLSVVLQDLAAQADFDFLCDCYLNSAETIHVYDRDPAWTADVALTWIARTFGHKIIYRGGLLEVATVTPGLDLRLEPPTVVANSLDAQIMSGQLPNREGLLVLSACTQLQLQILALRHPVIRKTHTGHILQALRNYPFVHFYGSLTIEQQHKAMSGSGVNANDLSVAQHRLFDALFTIGLPSTSPTRYKVERNRFYVRSSVMTFRGKIRRDVVSFVATAPESAHDCRMAAL
jgi:hypothetical protein